jgi:very-short-patch-repair endonuclease
MLKVNKPVFNFYFGASMDLIAKARVLRKNMTPAESILWDHLRRKALEGYRFRRQHPAGRFILDFYCHPLRLAIELDGSVHHLPEQAEYDADRLNLNASELQFSASEMKKFCKISTS